MNFVLIISTIIALGVGGLVIIAEGTVLETMNIFIEDWNCSDIPSDAWTVNCNKVKSISSGMFLLFPAIGSLSSWVFTANKLGSAFD